MRDCAPPVRLASEIPEYARDFHGDLADQRRERVVTAGARASNAGVGSDVPAQGSGGIDLARRFGCMACHNVTTAIVGPAFRDVAQRYRGDRSGEGAPDAQTRLVAKIRNGGSGAWGAVPMPAQSQLAEADARSVVDWILAGAK